MKTESTSTNSIQEANSTLQETWNQHWKSIRFKVPKLDANSYHMVDAIQKLTRSQTPKTPKILEAGSGPGVASLELSREGAQITLLDLTQPPLLIGKEHFKNSNQSVTCIQGSLFSIPLESDSYDIVFNAGTLEHFSADLQRLALMEMTRVAKPNGWVITFNGYARSLFYRLGKFLLEKTGRWTYGKETPVLTFKDFSTPEMKLITEQHFGFNGLIVEGFKLLGMEPVSVLARKIYFSAPKFLTRSSDRILSLLFGGYLLMSAFRKTDSLTPKAE